MYRKYRNFTVLVLAFVLVSCKKNESGEKMAEVGGAKKYAKYKAVVTKETNLKDWVATIEKAEEVTVLEERSVKSSKGKEINISKVQLSDDKVGFIESSHLGNEPIVFIKDTKAYIRPSPLVKVYAEITEGTIGFMVEQKDGWTQVYVGKIGDTWVTSQWVEDGSYSTNTDLLIDAKQYENAVALLKDKKEEAEELLNELKNNARTNQFKVLAEKTLSPGNPVDDGQSRENNENTGHQGSPENF